MQKVSKLIFCSILLKLPFYTFSSRTSRMSPSKSQTPEELQELGKQDNETDLEWAQRVSQLYNPDDYPAKMHCENDSKKQQKDQLCYCLLPESFGLNEKTGKPHQLSGSHMKFSTLSEITKEHTTSGRYNCTEQMNICHHMLHYDSIFTDGPIMLEELVGGGLMTKVEMEQCFMRSFYYASKQREMSIQYQKHLIGVHAHYDLKIYEKDGSFDDIVEE